MKSLARSYTEMAVQRLAGIAQRGASEAAVVAACAIILDRGWGKAEQVHSGAVDGELRITIRSIIEDKMQSVSGNQKLIEGQATRVEKPDDE